MAIALVNERNSTAEAKERYWLMYPPQGLTKLIPAGLRTPQTRGRYCGDFTD